MVSTWDRRAAGLFGRRPAVTLAIVAVCVAASIAGIATGWPSPAGLSGPADAIPTFLLDVAGEEITQQGKTRGTLRVVEAYDGAWVEIGSAEPSLVAPVAIDLHGSSSLRFPKKSYGLELRDERGEDRARPLVGLPAHSDWVLHGCGLDDTCLRNALAYELGRDLGHYAPRTRFIELFVDRRYHGVYLLVERIRRHEDRVDLPKPAAAGGDGDLTGGYIFKLELAEGTPADEILRDWVSPVSSLVYSYHYPRYDDITEAQKQYLHDHVAAFERVLLGSRWTDPATGYRHWIDVPSWVDFALLQELSNNPDAYQKSHFFQKWPESRGNRIALGPLWDFDAAFGIADVRDTDRTDVWAHEMNRFPPGVRVAYDPPGLVPHVPEYWERLWSDPAFQADLRCRWDQLRAGPLHLDAITGHLDRWTSALSAAQPRDDSRWALTEPYAARVSRLETWLAARLAWMDEHLPGVCGRS
jgi:hypothetical protein